jgi:hypothetical protein
MGYESEKRFGTTALYSSSTICYFIRRTNGRSLGTKQKAMLFRKCGSIAHKSTFLVFKGLKPSACGDCTANGWTCTFSVRQRKRKLSSGSELFKLLWHLHLPIDLKCKSLHFICTIRTYVFHMFLTTNSDYFPKQY